MSTETFQQPENAEGSGTEPGQAAFKAAVSFLAVVGLIAAGGERGQVRPYSSV